MDNPVPADRALKNWIPAGAGFFAAAIVIAWLNPIPPKADTLKAVLFIYALALIYGLLVLGASASAAFLAWLAIRIIPSKHPPPPRITWRIASRAVWLLPLYLFSAAKSGWAIIAAVLLTLGLVHVLRNLQPASPQRPALSSGWKVFSCVLAGAAIEAALVATGTERERAAIPIVAMATLIVAWHATRSGCSGPSLRADLRDPLHRHRPHVRRACPPRRHRARRWIPRLPGRSRHCGFTLCLAEILRRRSRDAICPQIEWKRPTAKAKQRT